MSEQNSQVTTPSQSYYAQIKQKIFENIGNYMQKGYKFIKIKQPRTKDEQAYLNSYQDMFLLQSSGLLLLSLSGIYFVKIALKGKHAKQKLLKPLAIKAGILAGLGTVLSFNAFMINMKQKTLQKTQAYGKQFEALAKSITPENIV